MRTVVKVRIACIAFGLFFGTFITLIFYMPKCFWVDPKLTMQTMHQYPRGSKVKVREQDISYFADNENFPKELLEQGNKVIDYRSITYEGEVIILLVVQVQKQHSSSRFEINPGWVRLVP